jgi:hypothetical protein
MNDVGTANPLWEAVAASDTLTAGGSTSALSPLETALRAVRAIADAHPPRKEDLVGGKEAIVPEADATSLDFRERDGELYSQHKSPSQRQVDLESRSTTLQLESPLCWSLRLSADKSSRYLSECT